MNLVLILIIIIGSTIAVILLTERTREGVAGICAAAMDTTVNKNANKEKALAFIRQRGEASNSDIREHLGLSSRTIVRYMDELEKEGKVEQEGEIGQAVTYRLK